MLKLKNCKPILIISGEPFSIFNEIFLKSIKHERIKNSKRPIVLIGSKDLLLEHMKKLNFNFKLNNISLKNIQEAEIKRNLINIIDIKFNFKKPFDKISSKSTNYIKSCFELALNLQKKIVITGIINGPISKSHFKVKNLVGITEYLAKLNNKNSKEVMLIYNKSLSVSPITTHVPIKNVHRYINKNKIINNIKTIVNFYKNKINKKKIRFAITGFNPHCESRSSIKEENKFIIPAIKFLKSKGFNIKGPFPADTIFIKKIRNNFDVIIGMYHDQVLAPFKAIYEFDAINITLGLDFIRLSPDHGPNNKELGKNISDPKSLIECIHFLNKINVNKS